MWEGDSNEGCTYSSECVCCWQDSSSKYFLLACWKWFFVLCSLSSLLHSSSLFILLGFVSSPCSNSLSPSSSFLPWVREDLAMFLKQSDLSSYKQMLWVFFPHNHFWICCLHPLPVVLISCAVYFPFALSLLCLISDTVRDGAAQEMVKQLVGKWDNTKWWILWKKARSACDLYAVGELFLVKPLNSAGLHKTNLIGKNQWKRALRSV